MTPGKTVGACTLGGDIKYGKEEQSWKTFLPTLCLEVYSLTIDALSTHRESQETALVCYKISVLLLSKEMIATRFTEDATNIYRMLPTHDCRYTRNE